MKISDRELGRRLAALEGAAKISAGAYVDIVMKDGTRKRLLWREALLDALNGIGSFDGEQVADVDGGELAGLIKAVLL